MRNRHRIADDYYKAEPLRPVFEQNELQHAIWLELVPHKLKMVIVEPGMGPNPKVGEFLRVKQFIYLQNMASVKQERVTYTFGRNKLISGLESCLALSREGFKGRLYIDSSFAYGEESLPGIPAKSNLVIDLQVNSITAEPLSTGDYDDQELICQIMEKSREGDSFAKSGNYHAAQRCYESAFARIQSTRCKEIKNYLYSQSKIAYMVNNGERTEAEIAKEIGQVVRMYDVFDLIKIKTVEMALLNKDYYRVIILSKQCVMENRLEQNPRVLAARARAFSMVGQFESAIQIIQHLHDQTPEIEIYAEELKRIQERQKQFSQCMQNSTCEPVLALTTANKRPKREKKAKIHYPSEKDEYEADDDEEMPGMQPFSMGMGMQFYQDFSYFE